MPGSSVSNARADARTFLIDTVFVFGAQILSKLRGLLMMPLLIHGLGVDTFGTWSQLLAFTVLVCAITGLNLHHSLIRFIAATPADAAKAYATTLSAIIVVTALVCALIGSAATAGLRELLVGSTDPRILWLSLLVVLTAVVRNLNLNLYRAVGRLRFRSAVDFIGTTGELTALILVGTLGGGLNDLVWTLAICGGVIAAGTTLHGFRLTGISPPNRALLSKALRYGLPLVPAAISMWFLDRSDRFVISYFLDQSDVGIYSAHYAIGSIILFVQAPLQVSLVPKIMQLWERDRALAVRYIELSFRFFIAAAAFFLAVVPLLAPSVLHAIASSGVAADSSINVALIGLGLAFWGLSVIETCTLYSANRTRVVGGVTLLCAISNAGLCVVLVPRMGIRGAAIATAASYLLCWLGLAHSASSAQPVSRNLRLAARACAAATFCGALAWLTNPRSLAVTAGVLLVATILYGVLLVALRVIQRDETRALASWTRARYQRTLARSKPKKID